MLVLDQLQETDRWLKALALAIFAGLLVLVGGLWYVQVVASKRYVHHQIAQSFRTVRIPAVRGRILDRHGNALAENRPSYNASIYLEELSRFYRTAYAFMISNETARVRGAYNRKLTRAERLELGRVARYLVTSNVVQRLGERLGQTPTLAREDFEEHYLQRLALPLPAVENLDSNQVAKLMEQTGLPPGVDLDVQPTRVYQYGAGAAHVLGYLRRDNSSQEGEDAFFNYRLADYRGVIGIEGYFDEKLRGRAGVKSVLVNSLGYRQSENIWTAAEPGHNVVLTLDLYLQQAAEKAMGISARESGTARGAAVIMDAQNGDLLAMVSTPTFAPSQFVPGISQEEMDQLNDPILRPLINRASQERYPPGSVFKIVTALACLEAGAVDPREIYSSAGHAQVGNQTIGDTAPPGDYDFKRAFKLSSNTYFIHFGLKAGRDNLLRMGHRFHLGEPMDLPTSQSDEGVFPNRETIARQEARGDPWTEGDTANLCIGQGMIAVNPVQVAVMTAAIANGGRVFWPRLVARVEPLEPSSSLEETVFFPSRLRGELGASPGNLEVLREAMLADVEDADGTGRRAAVPGVRIFGKTGTAEIKRGNRLIDKITWFASFAAHENRQYVVVVMIESGASGGLTCAPVAGRIYEAIKNRPKPVAGDAHLAGGRQRDV